MNSKPFPIAIALTLACLTLNQKAPAQSIWTLQKAVRSVTLDGTYTLSGTTIDFDHPADTFVRDFLWTYKDGTLSTNEEVVLQRN